MAKSKKILAGDVGGTKVNLAFCEVQNGRARLQFQKRFESAQFQSLGQILETYLAENATNFKGHRLEAACFGVPGPVIDGRCQTVNLPWVIEASQLQSHVGGASVRLFNDLEAMAHGMLSLEVGSGLVSLKDGPVIRSNRGLIAPGTGLGEALVFEGTSVRQVSPSEGGHCDFGPQTEEQIELLKWLWQKHKHASWEHVASGPAIYRLYRFLGETKRATAPTTLAAELGAPGVDPSALIARYAVEGKFEICVRAMDLWLYCLGAEAGNLFLKGMCRGGIYIGGGVVPHILELFKRPSFHNGFLAKGRMSPLLESVPVYGIVDQLTALYGAALAGA